MEIVLIIFSLLIVFALATNEQANILKEEIENEEL